MLGKIEGRRKRGQQRMRWLGGIIDSMAMNLSRLWEIVEDREAWCAAAYGVTKSRAQLSYCTTAEAETLTHLPSQSSVGHSSRAGAVGFSVQLSQWASQGCGLIRNMGSWSRFVGIQSPAVRQWGSHFLWSCWLETPLSYRHLYL